MNLFEKYKNCTVQGCQTALGNISGLDDHITIGQMRAFLDGRINEVGKETNETKLKLLRKLEGKCFKIVYSLEHTVLLKIDSIRIIEAFGDIDVVMIGEQITKYKGQIRWEPLTDESDKKYSNYIPADNMLIEFTVDKFNEIKEKVLLLNEIINIVI